MNYENIQLVASIKKHCENKSLQILLQSKADAMIKLIWICSTPSILHLMEGYDY